MMNFKTKRLEVKPLSDEDRESVIDLVTDEMVKQTYMLPDFASREDAIPLFQRLKTLSQGNDRLVGGIYLNGRFIGFMNEVESQDKSIELGYAIAPKYHNCGYCTEALTGAIAYLFQRGFNEVIAGAFEGNDASFRVMIKSGMEKLERQDEIEYRGNVHRCVYYAKKKNPVD